MNFNPDLLPPDRREAASQAHQRVLRETLVARLRMEGRALLGNALEALRTAGVVLAVLLVTGVYTAPLWVILTLMFAPPTWTGLVMLAAIARHAWRRWRTPTRKGPAP